MSQFPKNCTLLEMSVISRYPLSEVSLYLNITYGGGVFTLSIVILNIHHINDIKYEIESYDNIPPTHNELPRATTFYTPLP